MRYGHASARKRLHHAIFAINLMRAGEKLPGWLFAHDIALAAAGAGGDEQKGRVRLTAFKLSNLKRSAIAFHGLAAISIKTGHIKAMCFANGRGFQRGGSGFGHVFPLSPKRISCWSDT